MFPPDIPAFLFSLCLEQNLDFYISRLNEPLIMVGRHFVSVSVFFLLSSHTVHSHKSAMVTLTAYLQRSVSPRFISPSCHISVCVSCLIQSYGTHRCYYYYGLPDTFSFSLEYSITSISLWAVSFNFSFRLPVVLSSVFNINLFFSTSCSTLSVFSVSLLPVLSDFNRALSLFLILMFCARSMSDVFSKIIILIF